MKKKLKFHDGKSAVSVIKSSDAPEELKELYLMARRHALLLVKKAGELLTKDIETLNKIEQKGIGCENYYVHMFANFIMYQLAPTYFMETSFPNIEFIMKAISSSTIKDMPYTMRTISEVMIANGKEPEFPKI